MSGQSIYYNPLAAPIYVMPKPVSSACNLDCTYCYYLEKETLYGKGRNHMSLELLEKFTKEYIEAQPTPHVMFTWHGGEALLRGIDFFKKAIDFQTRYAQGREIANSLQTNGTLLNDEWCRFFKKNNFLIGISLDGPEHCHDRFRLDRRGEGTFEKTMAGVRLLQKHKVEFNVLSVVNSYNANYPLEVYDFFKSIGAQFVQFSPVVERKAQRADGLTLLSPKNKLHQDVTDWSVSASGYGHFLTTIFDKWVRQDVGRFFVTMFDATLAGYMGVAPGTCIWAKSCGHAGAMEFNGDVYSCDHYVFPEYKLGNLNHSSLVAMMLSPEQMRFGQAKYSSLPRQCMDCDFLKLCYGECPKNRIIQTADGEPSLNYLCAGLKHYFSHTRPYMEFMANELRNQRSPMNVMQWVKSWEYLSH